MIDYSQVKDHYRAVVQEAEQRGLEKKLRDVLNYLDGYACRTEAMVDYGRTKCVLHKDFAPLSFTFDMYKRDKNDVYQWWFCGGIIFHSGEQDWSVHT